MEPEARGRVERRLAAILAADVAGYSRLIEADEEGTLGRLKTLRAEIIDPQIAGHKGRIVKTTGDGLLVEFASVVDALRCAAGLQVVMAESNALSPPGRRIEFRIGINVGDVVVEDGDIFGDGVNVAARLEGLAEPGGICVSARVQEDAAGRLDLAFEDIGEQPLKNISRPVRVFRVRSQSPHPNPPPRAGEGSARGKLEPAGVTRGARVGAAELPPLPDKPSIAVLPFANMSGDPEQEYFADGMVEEIITALSRIRWLFVIARNSSFTYKGQAVDVKQIGRELGVRYVLEGSVRKGGNRIRITAQLIDAQSGTHLWADRFDGSLEDVFDLQDEVASSVAGVIEPALQAAEIRRSGDRPTSDLTAYDFYLRALPHWGFRSHEHTVQALDLLEQAIAIDRHYGPALAWAAMCHMTLVRDGWAEEPETFRRKGMNLARRALQAGENDPRILVNAANVLAVFGEDIGSMIGLVDRALTLNPSFARGWFVSGLLRLLAGQHELAIEHVETSLRLSPHERVGQPLSVMGQAYFFKHRFDEAAAKLLLNVQEHPGFPGSYRFLAACYAHMGRLDEARAIVARLRAITPLVVPSNPPFRKPEDRELLLAGIRLAAGEFGMSQTRRLVAILAADVAGYSRLMGADEEGTLERLKALRRELLDPTIAAHRGRIVKTTGDGLLVEFASVVDAVRCAVAVQQAMPERNTGVAADSRIELRIGINLGDVIVEGDDLYGDGVNIASRIEALADAGGVFVSNTVHDHVRDRLPFVFEDLGEQQVKNIARPVRVYRVCAPLTHPAASAPGSPLSRSAGEGAERRRREAGEGSLPLPDKPSIAVLPFANMSGDPEQEYFADGMVEEIITALSRIRWLFVIARNSTSTYKGQAVDVKQVGRELGVRYVLEGSVRKAGGRVRITAQLIDAGGGTHLWADRFDGSLEDVFELQDKVAISVAGVIEPTLEAAEIRRSSERPTGDITAYDLYLRALANFPWAGSVQISKALDLFEQAVARDPKSAPALAWAAVCHLRQWLDGYAKDPQSEHLRAVRLAEQALALGGADPGVLANVALVLADEGAEINSAIALIDRALGLNPSSARAWFVSGRLRVLAGECEKAIEHVRTSLRLGPRDPVGFPLFVMGMAYFFSRRFGEAAEQLALAVRAYAGWPLPCRGLAACYACMGRLDEARAVIEQLRMLGAPAMGPEIHIYRRPEDRELLLSGLRLAAGEGA